MLRAPVFERPGTGGRGLSETMEVAFAGRLASMTQREAADRIAAGGGRVVREPSERTSYLVVGHGAWPLGSDGLPDRSVLRTRRLKEQYPDLQIVSETTFLEMLGLTEKVEDLQRLFTTAQLSRILGVRCRKSAPGCAAS